MCPLDAGHWKQVHDVLGLCSPTLDVGHQTQVHDVPCNVSKEPGHRTHSHQTPGRPIPGHLALGHWRPGHCTRGHHTHGHQIPGHLILGHLRPGHCTHRHKTPGHLILGHWDTGARTRYPCLQDTTSIFTTDTIWDHTNDIVGHEGPLVMKHKPGNDMPCKPPQNMYVPKSNLTAF